jgi:hypothetical protein
MRLSFAKQEENDGLESGEDFFVIVVASLS